MFLMLVMAWFVLPRSSRFSVSSMPLLAITLIVVATLQWHFGLILFEGVAWVGAAYLIGFLIAFLLGQQWEEYKTGQAIDVFFSAVVIAAFLSVGMQLHQWLQLDEMDIWLMGSGLGRPFANFGQPNQLATFLLWGILALVWANLRGATRPAVTVLAIIFLLSGVALTHSRTAWLGLGLLVAASWYWRAYWPSRKLPWVVLGLGLYFLCCLGLISWLNLAFELNSTLSFDQVGRMESELRPQIWTQFFDAILRQPWFGYGINQVQIAQTMVASDHPAIFGVFAQGHNLFLDLILWFGFPIGIFTAGYLLRWLWLCGRFIRQDEDVVLFMLVILVGNHAMLELPLHYAYFLLPTGLVLGVLQTRLKLELSNKLTIQMPRSLMIVVLSGLSIFFAIFVRDYFRVEDSYRTLRYELANFKYEVRGTEPDVIFLTQWRDFIRMARIEPFTPLTEPELAWFRNIASTMPSAGGSYKLAGALAMRNQAEEAQLWLTRLCKMQPKQQCEAVRANWQVEARSHPELEKVDWSKVIQSH